MFVVETKHIVDLEGTLAYTDGKCTIQNMILDDTTLEEIMIPLIHGDKTELAIVLDATLKKLFQTFPLVLFDDMYAKFGDISYRYTRGDVITWETRLPTKIGIVEPLQLLPEGQTTIEIKNDTLVLGDNIIKNFFYKFNSFEGIIVVNMELLKIIFEKHKDTPFILYLEEEFPICLEFKRTRYYVAPLDI